MNGDMLLQRVIDGDHEAFSALYRAYVDKLYSYGLSLGFNENNCLDAIQDVFCKIYTHRNELAHVQNISFYLFRSLKNRLIDINKKNKTEYLNPDYETIFHSDISIIETIIDKEEGILLQQKVKSLLLNLTNNQREAVYLRYMQEMDYDEIAELLNINSESVRKLVYRAILKMREQTGLGTGLVLLLLKNYYNEVLK
ncbi:MAG: polymerase sigma factor, sigma-70 family [Bacteroidetes bacterium]|nr:polymerase sigma factor, sigma-70 family [Bacteroidota bacterium]